MLSQNIKLSKILNNAFSVSEITENGNKRNCVHCLGVQQCSLLKVRRNSFASLCTGQHQIAAILL